MATGLSQVNLANAWLNMVSGTAFTAPSGTFAQLHVVAGDPGAAGTSNPSANTTRPALTWGAAATGSKAISSSSSWTMTATETIAYISAWSLATAGTFFFSAALTASKAVASGDTLTLSTLTFSLTPIAA